MPKQQTAEASFERELEVFRHEAYSATQFGYAYLALHAVAADRKSVEKLLNTAPLFWNTAVGALQMSAFITLGRIFDQSSSHNLDKLLRIAQDNRHIFSKQALGSRKKAESPDATKWLENYLRSAYVPTDGDFRRLRRHVKKWRKVYDATYRGIRHKLFAHREVTDIAESEELFAKTNIREFQNLLLFLRGLHEALWQMFFNGRKPILGRQRISIHRMRKDPAATRRRKTVQERVTFEIERFLLAAADVMENSKP